MDISAIQKMYTYHFALHRKVWDTCISTLTDDQFVKDVGYSLGSIRNQCFHVIRVDARWISRLKGVELPDYGSETDYPTKIMIRSLWNRVENEIMTYVNSLTDADLSRVFSYDMPHRGGMKTNPVWEILVHVVNHGTDHRAQMLAMLHQIGAPTLEQDMMLYWWE